VLIPVSAERKFRALLCRFGMLTEIFWHRYIARAFPLALSISDKFRLIALAWLTNKLASFNQ
jgi:hypothetical protein